MSKVNIPRPLRLLLIVLVVVLSLSLAFALGFRKTVTVNVNGQSRTLTTYAFRVGDLLHALSIPLSPADDLSPSQDSWLKNGDNVTLVRAVPVQILSDGKLSSIYSAGRVPASLLSQAGIQLFPGDKLFSNGLPIGTALPFKLDMQAISFQVVRSTSFVLIEDGNHTPLTSNAPFLGSALWSAGYVLSLADELVPPAETPLTPELSATLHRSRQVIITTQEGNFKVRTAAMTVEDALMDAHLPLQGLDYSIPPPAASIPSSGVVRLVRVTEEILLEQSPIEFETQFQPLDNLAIDSQTIVQPGEYGLTAKRIRVRYEDGQEVSRQVDNEWTAREPVPRIIGYGTMLTMYTEVVDGTTIQYWRKLSMYATSYHPSEVGNTTASGLPLQKGVAAIDLNLMPFFTRLYVPGYGEAIAADIGGGVIGRWIDLGYSDFDYVPWHQWVTVYFLWPPPDTIVWIIP